MTVNTVLTTARNLAVTRGIKHRTRAHWSDRARYSSCIIITVTRLAAHRGRTRPVRLRCTGWRRTTVTRIARRRAGQSTAHRKVNVTVDMRRLQIHRRVVAVGQMALTAIRRTGRIRTVSRRTYMSVMSTAARRTVAVAAGAVVGKGDAPGVGPRGAALGRRTVVVAIVGVTRPSDPWIGVGGVGKGSGPRYSEGPVQVARGGFRARRAPERDRADHPAVWCQLSGGPGQTPDRRKNVPHGALCVKAYRKSRSR